MPFHRYYGQWKFNAVQDNRLVALIDQLDGSFLSVDRFEQDCLKGLAFESSIPQQFGLGSSGALTAAIYHAYAREHESDIHTLQKQLAQIESIFHGKSSGTDALVSFTRSIVHSKGQQSRLIQEDSFGKDGLHIFLLNSNVPRSAKTYIEKFGELASTAMIDLDRMCALVDLTIDSMLTSNLATAFESIQELSLIQFEQLPDFIPDETKVIWKTGLQSEEYYCKICGAGGGGFFLVFSETPLREISGQQLIALQ